MESKGTSALATEIRSDELKNCRSNRKNVRWPDEAVKYINKHCIFALQSLFFPCLILLPLPTFLR